MHDHAPAHAHVAAEHVAGEHGAAETEGGASHFATSGAIPAVGGAHKDPGKTASELAYDSQAGASKAHSDHGDIHIITEAGLRHLRQSGKEGVHAAKVLYDNPNAYIVLKPGQQMPDGWKGKATLLFDSYASFAAAAHSGKIGGGISAVVYDNEHWAQTPPNEKADPAKYSRMFMELAHSMGMTFIAAPTRKFFKGDARYADIIDVQLQDREIHTGSYARALRHDAKLAHHLNPDIKVVGQITSNRNHLDPNHNGHLHDGIDKAEQDVLANAPYVDGFWGYVYQQNHESVHAGQTILKDLAKDEEKGRKF